MPRGGFLILTLMLLRLVGAEEEEGGVRAWAIVIIPLDDDFLLFFCLGFVFVFVFVFVFSFVFV